MQATLEQQLEATVAMVLGSKRTVLHLGRRFGRLLVMAQGKDPSGHAMLVCLCDCGVMITANTGNAVMGKVRSCGCLRKENTRTIKTTHGRSRWSPEYRAWCHMKERCCNDNDKAFKNYGGRGITVCEQWLESFEAFFAHIGKRPLSSHSIERINNDGNYEPGNVRWATRDEQVRNRRTTRRFTFNGKTQILADWAKDLNVSVHTLESRLMLYGWSVERALTEPVRK